MERYNFTPEQQAQMESMLVPFAVYQFLEQRVVTIALSDGFCELFGYSDRAVAYYDMDYDMYKDTHPDDVARISDAAYRFAVDNTRYEVIYRSAMAGGGYRIIHAFGKHVYTAEGVRLAYVWYTDEGVYAEDGAGESTGLNKALSSALHEESILKASQYDYLTGLPSMTYFFSLAEIWKEGEHREGRHPVFLFMDLTGMKFFNHKYGFAQGDKFLQMFAKLLAATFGAGNCSRLGQDHFGAFTPEEGLEEVLRQFFADCEKLNDGNSLPVHVGIYSTSREDVPVSTACDRAKLACEAIGKTYASTFKYYSDTLRRDIIRQRYILDNLDKAISEKWIRVYYQPLVRAVNGRVCDEEALARWIDPVEGLLPPAEFIPTLEDAGLIYKLDLYVLDQVLEKMRLEKEAGLTIVPHSVNLSRSDFDACDMVEEIRRRVDATDISRSQITIEITESVVGSDFDFMKTQVERFRALGFPVWMDDFGSGYSSLDVLQSIRFDLIKFDMSFMQRLDEGAGGKIILTELMKMATALGVDTACEGVETEAQVRFLQEIGCSKLQGFYYAKAIPLEQIIERYAKGIQIGYENPEESEYFEAMGRVNLYDMAMLTSEEDGAFQNYFNTLPMAIMEIRGGMVRFARTNQSYREFLKRFFDLDLAGKTMHYTASPFGPGSSFMKVVQQCCAGRNRALFDERMPDGSIVHAFIKRVATNPVTGTAAAAIAILSVTDANEGATYAGIARALAADYYNIYYVDLDTEKFIEYSSSVGGEELAIERHGENFFASAKRDTMTRIYEADRDYFLSIFTKENVIRELDKQGVFTATYRLVDTGRPMYVNMKVTRMRSAGNAIIMGISIVDAQMQQKASREEARTERGVLARIMALSDDYLSLYTIDPNTGRYTEYKATDEYESLGFAKSGEDFFTQAVVDGKKTVYSEDLPAYLEQITRENILARIGDSGIFKMQYRLVMGGELRPVSLRIAPFHEDGQEKLVAGLRAWKIRK